MRLSTVQLSILFSLEATPTYIAWALGLIFTADVFLETAQLGCYRSEYVAAHQKALLSFLLR